MKQTIHSTLVVLFLCSPMVSADDDPCAVYDVSAKGAMEARQRGVPLADAMKVVNGSIVSDRSPESMKAYEALKLSFLEAYKTPKFSTPSMQREAVNEFRSHIYGLCLQAMSEVEGDKQSK